MLEQKRKGDSKATQLSEHYVKVNCRKALLCEFAIICYIYSCPVRKSRMSLSEWGDVLDVQ